VELLAALTDEAITLTDTAPIRALQGRVSLLSSELSATGYNMPVEDFLRRVRAMFIVHNAANNQLQIGYSAYHAKATDTNPSTGGGLLKHMVKLEAEVRAQGGAIFETGLLEFAAKATRVESTAKAAPKSATHGSGAHSELQAMLANTSLSTLQKDVLSQHIKAAISAVKFAGAHPTDYKPRAHFCPLHGFNETHAEQDCNRCKSLKK
jgi:hypothetical protein